ncbi:MAG: hypothetical protein ACRDRI_23045 [Pseudonocardiaceae bacterium]
MADLPLNPWSGKFRRVIHATYAPHRGPVGATTLVVSTRGGVIKLDPHTAGVCTITIDEDGGRVLRDALIKWLG